MLFAAKTLTMFMFIYSCVLYVKIAIKMKFSECKKKPKVVDTKLCLTNIYFSATGCSMILAQTLDDSLKVLIGQGIWDNVK